MTPEQTSVLLFMAVLGAMAGFWGTVWALLRRNTMWGAVLVFWLSLALLVICLAFVFGVEVTR